MRLIRRHNSHKLPFGGMIRFLSLSCLAVVVAGLTGCGRAAPKPSPDLVLGRDGSGFVGLQPELDSAEAATFAPIRLADPQDKAVIVYLPGSGPEDVADACEPDAVEPGWRVPDVIAGLSGQQVAGKTILVYALCTQSVLGAYRPDRRFGTPKLRRRTKDLESFILALEKVGISPDRVIVAGHSTGGWAGLLAARREIVSPAGVIAFAPSFAGESETRAEGWEWLRQRELAYLIDGGRIDGMVFGFAGDPFEDPEALSVLQQIDRLAFNTVAPSPVCPVETAHLAFDTSCFSEEWRDEVSGFLEARLMAAGASRGAKPQ